MRAIALLLTTALVAAGCARGPGAPETELPAPILLPVPDDLAADERGVDAVPEKNAIQLEWRRYPVQEARIEIYRGSGERPQAFSLVGTASAKDTVLVDEGVVIGTRYWYFLVGRQVEASSPSSDTVSYKLLEKAYGLWEDPTPRPKFRWRVNEIPVEYVIKLFELPSDNRVWFARVYPNFNSLTEEVEYNFDGSALADSLVPGRAYRWRVDTVGPEAAAGSESEWRVFVCQ